VVHFEESCDKNSRRRFECQVSEQFHVGLLLVLVMVLFSALRALSLENFENPISDLFRLNPFDQLFQNFKKLRSI